MIFMDYVNNIYSRDYRMANYIDELYWDGGCDTEKMFNFILQCSKADGIVIVDIDTVDYDRALYILYRDTEKGLS